MIEDQLILSNNFKFSKCPPFLSSIESTRSKDDKCPINQLKEFLEQGDLLNPVVDNFRPVSKQRNCHSSSETPRYTPESKGRFPQGFFIEMPVTSKRRTIRLNQNMYSNIQQHFQMISKTKPIPPEQKVLKLENSPQPKEKKNGEVLFTFGEDISDMKQTLQSFKKDRTQSQVAKSQNTTARFNEKSNQMSKNSKIDNNNNANNMFLRIPTTNNQKNQKNNAEEEKKEPFSHLLENIGKISTICKASRQQQQIDLLIQDPIVKRNSISSASEYSRNTPCNVYTPSHSALSSRSHQRNPIQEENKLLKINYSNKIKENKREESVKQLAFLQNVRNATNNFNQNQHKFTSKYHQSSSLSTNHELEVSLNKDKSSIQSISPKEENAELCSQHNLNSKQIAQTKQYYKVYKSLEEKEGNLKYIKDNNKVIGGNPIPNKTNNSKFSPPLPVSKKPFISLNSSEDHASNITRNIPTYSKKRQNHVTLQKNVAQLTPNNRQYQIWSSLIDINNNSHQNNSIPNQDFLNGSFKCKSHNNSINNFELKNKEQQQNHYQQSHFQQPTDMNQGSDTSRNNRIYRKYKNKLESLMMEQIHL